MNLIVLCSSILRGGDINAISCHVPDKALGLTLFVKSESPNKEKRHVNCILCSRLNGSLSSVYSLAIAQVEFGISGNWQHKSHPVPTNYWSRIDLTFSSSVFRFFTVVYFNMRRRDPLLCPFVVVAKLRNDTDRFGFFCWSAGNKEWCRKCFLTTKVKRKIISYCIVNFFYISVKIPCCWRQMLVKWEKQNVSRVWFNNCKILI